MANDGAGATAPVAHPGAYPTQAAAREQRHPGLPNYPPQGRPVTRPTKQNGSDLAVVGIALAVFWPVIGVIVSLVARSRARAAGASTRRATAGVVIGIVVMLFWAVAAIPLAASGGL